MTKIRCLAIDDEPLGLKLIKTFSEQTPFIELIGECESAIEALEILKNEQIDLVLLDINMPKLNGIELARLLKYQTGSIPKIIFITAHNHYAIESYKVDAIDYLLKPYGYEEFLRATTKVLKQIEFECKLQNKVETAPVEEDAIFVKVQFQWVRINFSDINYIEGLKDYVQIFLDTKDRKILSLTSLKSLEDRLPTSQFVRIHRSFIISLKKITSITKNSVVIQGKEINIGEQYKDAFRMVIDKWLL